MSPLASNNANAADGNADVIYAAAGPRRRMVLQQTYTLAVLNYLATIQRENCSEFRRTVKFS